MIRIIDQQEMKNWLRQKTFITGNFPDVTCIGNMLKDKLVAVAGYSQYNRGNRTIFFNLAGTEGRLWLTRDFLWYMFAYPFLQLDLTTIYATIEKENEKSIHLANRLDFRFLNAFVINEKEIYSFKLSKKDCKYLKPPKEVKLWVL